MNIFDMSFVAFVPLSTIHFPWHHPVISLTISLSLVAHPTRYPLILFIRICITTAGTSEDEGGRYVFAARESEWH